MQFQVTASTASGGTMVTGVSADSAGRAVENFFKILDAVRPNDGSILVTDVKVIPPKRYRNG